MAPPIDRPFKRRWPSTTTRNIGKERLDVRYRFLSDQLRSLRELEVKGDVEKHRRMCDLILAKLMQHKNFVKDATFWTELYFRSVWQYPFLHSLHGIPFVNVTKHNHILGFYMRLFARRPELHNIPIVHFDTHSDLNEVTDSTMLPEHFHKYVMTGEDVFIQKAGDLAWDIGAAISSVLYTCGARPYLWIMPSWLKDPDVLDDYIIKKGKRDLKMALMAEGERAKKLKEKSALPVLVKSHNHSEGSRFGQIHDPSTSKKGRKDLGNFLKEDDRFILDVDLDYFTCNGIADASSIDDDVASPGRIPRLEMIREPRGIFSRTNEEYIRYLSLVDSEVREIDRRLNGFRSLLSALKSMGKHPVAISISDSTGVDFTDCTDCASITNGYVSSHLALYVRMKVLRAISSIFSNR